MLLVTVWGDCAGLKATGGLKLLLSISWQLSAQCFFLTLLKLKLGQLKIINANHNAQQLRGGQLLQVESITTGQAAGAVSAP